MCCTERGPGGVHRHPTSGWACPRGGGYVVDVTTAQTLFAIALASITLLITLFGVYVVSTTVWGNRWFRKR